MNTPRPFKNKIGLLSVLCAGRFIHLGNGRYRFDEALPEASILIYDQVERAYKKKLPLKIKLYSYYRYSRYGLRRYEQYELYTVVPSQPLGYRMKEVS